MATTGFTPGPWKADPYYRDGLGSPPSGYHVLPVADPGIGPSTKTLRAVADVPFSWHGNGEHTEANARLIAAAPDLFEALVAVQWAPPRFKCVACDGQPSTGHTGTCRVAAALALARGDQP